MPDIDILEKQKSNEKEAYATHFAIEKQKREISEDFGLLEVMPLAD